MPIEAKPRPEDYEDAYAYSKALEKWRKDRIAENAPYRAKEKLKDVANWTWEGMTEDIKRALKKGWDWQQKKSKKLDEATDIAPAIKDAVPRPNPKGVEEKLKEERKQGITRGRR